jgi:sugar phosphate isomerase/epimerase
MRERLYLNTYDKTAASIAFQQRMGIEFDELLFYDFSCVRNDRETSNRIEAMRGEAERIDRRILHGTVASTDFAIIQSTPSAAVRELYETSYFAAKQLGAHKLVFHSDFIPGQTAEEVWLTKSASFWKEFMAGKHDSITICLENFVDENPITMATLCDAVDVPCFRLCLDTGHAHANSPVCVFDWITVLGTRINHVHLHNNDGTGDRHWPLGKGTLNMNLTLSRLQEFAPSATMTIEADFEPSLEWL